MKLCFSKLIKGNKKTYTQIPRSKVLEIFVQSKKDINPEILNRELQLKKLAFSKRISRDC